MKPKPVRASATATFPGTREAVWDAVLEANLPEIMPGRGVLAGVTGTRGTPRSEWGSSVGQTRTIVLSDESTVHEEITGLEHPSRIEYRIGDISGPFGKLTPGARASFELADVPDGVQIRWTYEYDAHNLLTKPLVFIVIRYTWEPYLQEVLDNLRASIQRRVPGRPGR